MRRHFRLPIPVIAGALLGLIALLATLQYQWLGQISGAERDRMKATLNTRATAFSQDVDRELTRAYLMFQLDAMQPDQGTVAALMARYDRWQVTAPLAPSQVPASFVVRPPISTVWASVPALVIPAPMLMLSHIDMRQSARAMPMQMPSGFRYSIVVLDADYMKKEMLPALAQLHFQGTGDGFDYQLAVVPSTAGEPPLYHSVREFAPAPDANVDAHVDFFQVRVKDFEPLVAEVTRFTTFTAIPPGAQGRHTQAFVRQSITAPQGNVAITSAPLSIVMQSGRRGESSSATQQRIGAMLSGAAASFGARAGQQPQGQWRLMVKHPSGSLEHAVNTARRRNLVISSSILGILGLSVGFLVLSTRRAHDLARQQLEFVATVSHELRTPLAVIRSAGDNLADGVVNDEARIRQYGELVRREGLRLTDLVEQILEFAGMQSAQRTMARQ